MRFLWLVLFCLLVLVGSAQASVVDTLRAGNWVEIPNSSLSAANVFPSPVPFGGSPNGGDWSAIMTGWSGGAYDTKRNRLLIFGGGHGDYAGNEIYYFQTDSLIWRRRTNPPAITVDSSVYNISVSSSGSSAFRQSLHPEVYADSTPRSLHTYDGLEYLPIQDKFMSWSGSTYSSGSAYNGTFWFNDSTGTWTRKASTPIPNGNVYLGAVSGYDPVTKHVIVSNAGNNVYEFDPVANTWTRRSNSSNGAGDEQCGAVDPVRRKFITVGGSGSPNGRVYVWDLNQAGDMTRVTQTTTGDNEIIHTRYPALFFDPVADRIVAWNGGRSVYYLNTTTWVWTKYTNTATGLPPTRLDGNGIAFGPHGKMQYIPDRNLYVTVDRITNNVWFYKPPVISRIDMKLKTWRSRPLPAQGVGPGPNGSKHMRIAFNEANQRLYFCGGDYSTNTPGGFPESGRQEIYSYGVKDSSWTYEEPYCVVSGKQPMHPDEVGWTWDSRRNKFWMIPGYQGTGTECGSSAVRDSIFTFDPTTSSWTIRSDVPNNPFTATIGDDGFAVYDSLRDEVTQFVYTGNWKATRLSLATNTWAQTNFNQNVDVAKEYTCYDKVGRKLYVVDAYSGATGGAYNQGHARLLVYNMDTFAFDTLAAVPGGVPLGRAQTHPVWDSTNRVILWLDWCCDNAGSTSRMLIYHPDTNQWETQTNQTPTGSYVFGNTTVYDPSQNVLIVYGGDPALQGGNSSFFMYRYGNGEGSQFTAAAGGGGGPTDNAPVVSAPAAVNGIAGYVTTFNVTASDPDGDAIAGVVTSGSAFSGGATFTPNATNTSGKFSWATTGGQAGTYAAIFSFENALAGKDTTSVVIASEPSGFGGLCAIWAQRAGDGKSTWYKGSASGWAGAKAFVGSSGYITIFPGCEEQFSVGTLPDSVTVVWEKRGVQEFNVREFGVVARGVNQLWADSLGVSIGGGPKVKSHLMTTATLDFDLTSRTVEDQTVSVPGALVGAVVDVAAPTGAVTTSVQYSAWVSQVGQVTVRARTSAAGENPGSGSFRITVWNY